MTRQWSYEGSVTVLKLVRVAQIPEAQVCIDLNEGVTGGQNQGRYLWIAKHNIIIIFIIISIINNIYIIIIMVMMMV